MVGGLGCGRRILDGLREWGGNPVLLTSWQVAGSRWGNRNLSLPFFCIFLLSHEMFRFFCFFIVILFQHFVKLFKNSMLLYLVYQFSLEDFAFL